MIYSIIFICLVIGFFALVSHKMNYPPYSTVKGVKNATAVKAGLFTFFQSRAIQPLIYMIAPLIQIESFKEHKMSAQLERAEIPMTAKEYHAQALVMALGTVLVGGSLTLVAVPQMLSIVIILSVIVYFHFFGIVRDKLKAKDKLIENELPKFIRAIVQGLKTEKDVIKLLETYETIAKNGLKYDIEILIMDLKSGSFEEGMMDFDRRVGNPYISRLVKALITVNSGDNQDGTLNHLLSDMTLLTKETMQRELNKRPGRVKLTVIPVVIMGILTLFYVIGVHLFNSLGGIM